MECDDAAVGCLVRKYDANEERLGGLQQSFERVVQQIACLSQMVAKQGASIEVTDKEFRSGFGNTTVPRDVLETLAQCLQALQAAKNEKQRMETCLQQASLGRFIQKQQDRDADAQNT